MTLPRRTLLQAAATLMGVAGMPARAASPELPRTLSAAIDRALNGDPELAGLLPGGTWNRMMPADSPGPAGYYLIYDHVEGVSATVGFAAVVPAGDREAGLAIDRAHRVMLGRTLEFEGGTGRVVGVPFGDGAWQKYDTNRRCEWVRGTAWQVLLSGKAPSPIPGARS